MIQLEKKVISWEQHSDIVRIIYKKIVTSGFRPDIIVAIQRGGLIPATQLSHLLNVRDVLTISAIRTIDNSVNSEKIFPVINLNFDISLVQGKKILIVDDIVGSGETMRLCRQALLKTNVREIKESISFLNISNWTNNNIDLLPKDCFTYIGYITKNWIIFPWEL
jgi:uncharacterized protein